MITNAQLSLFYVNHHIIRYESLRNKKKQLEYDFLLLLTLLFSKLIHHAGQKVVIQKSMDLFSQ